MGWSILKSPIPFPEINVWQFFCKKVDHTWVPISDLTKDIVFELIRLFFSSVQIRLLWYGNIFYQSEKLNKKRFAN